jgi:pyridoxine 4-dehydrogenase
LKPRDVKPASAAGALSLAPDLTLSRMGFGAMRLAGPGVSGPPRDRREAIAVLRTAVELGITHIDTSDYYGPFVVNQLIAEALHPYPAELRIVTKVGYRHSDDGSWNVAASGPDLVRAVHENLDHLRLDALDVVNLRVGGPGASVAEPLGALIQLQQQGLIRHLGVSNVSLQQLEEARAMTSIVCVQNLYNLESREDDSLVDLCGRDGIGFTPYLPLGAASLLRSEPVRRAAATVDASPAQVALAWLLQRSDTILLIPGTSSVAHLRQNVAAAGLRLPAAVVAALE